MNRVYTEQFGSYVCDAEQMLTHIRKVQTDIFRDTARWPCAICLHPADIHALRTAYLEHPTVLDLWEYHGVIKLFGMYVVTDDFIKGRAQLDTCKNCLYRCSPTDCEYRT